MDLLDKPNLVDELRMMAADISSVKIHFYNIIITTLVENGVRSFSPEYLKLDGTDYQFSRSNWVLAAKKIAGSDDVWKNTTMYWTNIVGTENSLHWRTHWI